MGFPTNDDGPGCNAKIMDAPYRDVRYVAAESEQDAATMVASGRGRHSLAEAVADCESWLEVYAVELLVKRVPRETEGEKP